MFVKKYVNKEERQVEWMNEWMRLVLTVKQGMLDAICWAFRDIASSRVEKWKSTMDPKGNQISLCCGTEGGRTERETPYGAIAGITKWEVLGAQIQIIISRVKKKGQIQELPRRLVSLFWKKNRFEENQEVVLRLAELEMWKKQSSGAAWWAPGIPGPETEERENTR